MSEKESYFSKKAISRVVDETINYINELNDGHDGYCVPDIEDVGSYLLKNGFINNNIHNTLVSEDNDGSFENCTAMIKKGRCGNPTTKSSDKFCSLHTLNPPDMTYRDFERFNKLKNKIR